MKIPIKRRVLLLRTCRRVDDRLLAHGDWEWPDQVGAIVTAPDWNPEAVCGGGLHGLLWGEGDPGHLEWGGSGAWMVVEADSREVVDLGDKVKVPRCIIRHIGDRVSAGAYLQAHGGAGRRIHGATATAGDAGTATAGYAGTATAGDDGLISVRWWDGRANRYRMLRGFIGQDGLLPNVAYRVEVVDGAPRWVRATPGGAA